MRAAPFVPACLCLAFALGCGDPEVQPAAPPPIDRTPASAPDGLLVELRMDGGDGTLRAFIERMPPSQVRENFPVDLESLVDALVALPAAVSGHLAPDSPLRAIMVEVEGVPRSALVVRLRERPDPAALHEGGPRGAMLVDESTAIVDDLAIVADDARVLERVLPYLAFRAIAEPTPSPRMVFLIPEATLRGPVRDALGRMLTDRMAGLRESARAARASHSAPPTLGEPEQFVALLESALRERLALLPDLGDATLTLAPTPSGLSVELSASITQGSPLAQALADRVPTAQALVTNDEEAAFVIATGATDAAQDQGVSAIVEALAQLSGQPLGPEERAQLDAALRTLAHARGPESALAVGATEATGAFVSLSTTGSPEGAVIPAPWGRRTPWFSAALGTLLGCDPREPSGPEPDVLVCDGRSLATRAQTGRLVAVAGRDAGPRAEASLAHLVLASAPASPDLARDLAGLPSSSFAILLARPVRVLPLLVALGGPPREGLPRGDGAMVLGLANEGGTLRVVFRASTAALSDLALVARLFEE